MKDDIITVRSSIVHIPCITERLRGIDYDEILSTTGRDPYEVLNDLWVSSSVSYVVLRDNEPVILYGVADIPESDRWGTPWMVTTEGVHSYNVKRYFFVNSKKYIKRCAESFKYLIGYVDVKNCKSVKWLDWSGFNIYFDEPTVIVGGTEFFKFDMIGGFNG